MTTMDEPPKPFSKRHGYSSAAPEITVWEDAPEGLRYVLLSAAHDKCKITPFTLRDIVCDVLRTRPDPDNWTPYPNVWVEVEGLVYGCEWFRVYDIVEAIAKRLERKHHPDEKWFEDEINDCMREMGIGWQLRNGLVQARGDDAHELLLAQARDTLETAGMPTAENELTEAVSDLSRRPNPDLSGAVHHAMAALECVAREVTGDTKATLGKIAGSYKDLFPKPIDEVVTKAWGYASENARHGREDRTLGRSEAQLVVGLSSSVAMYLIQKMNEGKK